MMKKRNATLLALSAIGLFTVLSPLSVSAETSNGHVELLEGSGTNGPLSLDNVSNFEFGSQTISTTAETYTATADLETVVTDLRGTGLGWNLGAKITSFKNTEHTLLGASFTLPIGTLSTTGNATAPVATETTLNDSTQTVLDAAQNSGLGKWSQNYTNATLEVPSGNYIGDYSATIDWTLTDGPTTP